MRLKKLELFGFKSFADRTELLFDEGVTCIVGPNGCGKSNISDAIRWVLGERSAKLLRGSKMEDVIFNGTDLRKPIAIAEVSLTVDNADRGLPIDYQEVTLTRRLYRSGESEYLINRTACRLKDVQDLILDTGIGSNSYSMIEQGRIDYILNADAEERRFLIEEAAGISKFKVKKEEAIRKLEKTEENRLRLVDIIHEVQRNIQYAERQARRARRYKEQLEKIKTLEITKAFHDLEVLAKEKSGLEEVRLREKKGLQTLEAERDELRKKQEAAGASLSGVLERCRTEEADRYRLISKIEQHEQQIRFHQEKRLETASRKGQIQQEQNQLRERIQTSEQEIEAKRKELDAFGKEKEAVSAALTRAEENLHQTEHSLHQLKAGLEQSRQEAFETAAEAAKIRNEYHRLAAFLEQSGEQKRKQEAGVRRIEHEVLNGLGRKETCEKEIARLEQRLAALETEKKNLAEEILQGNQNLENQKAEIDETERLLHEKETRLRLLEETDRAERACETSLLEAEGLQREFVKRLQEIFEVASGYEWALEAALGPFTHSLIADDLSTAETLLRRIFDQKPSSLGILIRSDAPQEDPEPGGFPSWMHPLKNHVQVKSGYEGLLNSLLKNVLVVDALPEGRRLEQLLAWAQTHKLLLRDGITFGPQAHAFYRNVPASLENALFQRARELEKLRAVHHELKDERRHAEEEAERLQKELADLGQKREALEDGRMNLVIQKESEESMKRGMEERLQGFQRELQILGFETQEIQSQGEQACLQKEAFEEKLAALETREKTLREFQEGRMRQMEALDRMKIEALHEAARLKARFENLEERNLLLQSSFEILAGRNRHDQERIQQLDREFQNLLQKEGFLQSEDERLGLELLQFQERRTQSEVTLGLIRREKDRLETENSVLQSELEGLQQHFQELRENLHQSEMKSMNLSYREKTLDERIHQNYRVHLQELSRESFPLEDRAPEDLEKEITEMRRRLDSIGAVNLLAVEEYEELKQRYDFLLAQQKDLDEAREHLLETIRKINRTTKGLFEETFAGVQKTFQDYYETLFQGGQARLVLLDESNPLESGIDIVVRPPGKKLQPITLLSGGEKALTAAALLFALFKIKPSPFCVLDEVDAPLDEANVDRFLVVLKTFLGTSQFIIVTHNRKTIVMGDSLYGVTMEESGVSKIVSVKINPASPQTQAPVHETVETVEAGAPQTP